jgi:hypothetical protein
MCFSRTHINSLRYSVFHNIAISNLSSGLERRRTHIAVRVGILQNYGDPQTAVAMEGTGICKRIGKCDVFHIALFAPTLELVETLM